MTDGLGRVISSVRAGEQVLHDQPQPGFWSVFELNTSDVALLGRIVVTGFGSFASNDLSVSL